MILDQHTYSIQASNQDNLLDINDYLNSTSSTGQTDLSPNQTTADISNELIGDIEGILSRPETPLAPVGDIQKSTSNYSPNTISQCQTCKLRPNSSNKLPASNLPGSSNSNIHNFGTSKTFGKSETFSTKNNYNCESMNNILQLSSDVLSQFQITITYGGITESTFIASLNRGLQIDLNKNYNNIIKKH